MSLEQINVVAKGGPVKEILRESPSPGGAEYDSPGRKSGVRPKFSNRVPEGRHQLPQSQRRTPKPLSFRHASEANEEESASCRRSTPRRLGFRAAESIGWSNVVGPSCMCKQIKVSRRSQSGFPPLQNAQGWGHPRDYLLDTADLIGLDNAKRFARRHPGQD